MVLSSSLPSIGAGALKNREDPKILGTSKVPQYPHYSAFAQFHATGHARNPAFFKPPPPSTKPLPSNALEPKSPSICSSLAPPIKTLLLSPAFRTTPPAKRTSTLPSMPLARKMPSSSHMSLVLSWRNPSCWKRLCVCVPPKVSATSCLALAYTYSSSGRSTDVFVPRQLLRPVDRPLGNARRTPGPVVCYRGTDRRYHHGTICRFPDRDSSHDMLW